MLDSSMLTSNELSLYGMEFIEVARGAKQVADLFHIAAEMIRRYSPESCLCLWMEDSERNRICRAHVDYPSQAGHVNHPEWLPIDSEVGMLIADDIKLDADWVFDDSCNGCLGYAYLRLQTFDGIRLLVTACVPKTFKDKKNIKFHVNLFRLLGQSLLQSIEQIRLRNERDLLGRISTFEVEKENRREFFNRVSDVVANAFHAKGCSIFVYDKFRDALVFGGSTGLFSPSSGQSLSAPELDALIYRRGEGITGWMFETKKSVRMYNAIDPLEWEQIDASRRISPVFKSAEEPTTDTQEPRPFLGMPIYCSPEGTFAGIIRLHGRKSSSCFLPSDEKRLLAVSAELGRSIIRWNEEIELRDSIELQQASSRHFREVMTRQPTLLAMLQAITDHAKDALGATAASVLLASPERQELIVKYDNANRTGLNHPVVVPFSKGLCGYAATNRVTIAESDVTAVGSLFWDLGDPTLLSDVKSEACAPILFGDSLLGVLNVDSDQKNWFHPDDRATLQTLENIAALAASEISRAVSDSFDDSVGVSAKEVIHLLATDFASLSLQVDKLISEPIIQQNTKAAKSVGEIATTCMRYQNYWECFYNNSGLSEDSLAPEYLGDIVERVVHTLKLKSDERELITLDLARELSRHSGSGIRVALNPLIIHIILVNFVQNAINASEDSPNPIKICAKRHEDDQVILSVEDQGKGMTLEEVNQAFSKPYHRVGGKGKGLLQVGRLARILGGKPKCDSVLGKGSVFSVELPIIRE
jgi:putative methionine-R-sulfoxide reductase with GAF domain